MNLNTEDFTATPYAPIILTFTLKSSLFTSKLTHKTSFEVDRKTRHNCHAAEANRESKQVILRFQIQKVILSRHMASANRAATSQTES